MEKQLQKRLLETSFKPGQFPASDSSKALSENLSIPGFERMTGSTTHMLKSVLNQEMSGRKEVGEFWLVLIMAFTC